MRKKEVDVEKTPEFATEEQEAEYWDTHSPLDVAEPSVEKVRVKLPKDRPITIRLDSESRRKLEKLAAKRGLGPSTFARMTLVSAIEEEADWQDDEGLIEELERDPPPIEHPEDTTMFVICSGYKEAEQDRVAQLRMLLSLVGFQLVTPRHSQYEKLKAAALNKEISAR